MACHMEDSNQAIPKITSDVCVVCTGVYVNDVDEDGDVKANILCGVWNNTDSLEKMT